MSIRKALLFSFIDRYASLLVGVLSSMVLARLLTPADIGIFSVTIVLLSFATSLRDFGAGQYLVQEKELTDDRIRSVWAVQLGIGLVMSVVALAASVPVAHFYREPRIQAIMVLMAISYLITPFGSITYAWLMRGLHYGELAVMRFSANASGALISVLLAWQGFGPISLAWGTVATTVVNATVSLFFRPKGYPWRPGLKELRRVLSFGSRLTSTTLIQTATTGAPELLLGKLQDLTAVGLFSRGTGLVAMFGRLVSDSVNTVAVSMFAKGARTEGTFTEAFVRANAYVTVLAWAFAASVACLAYPLIHVLYGGQWGASVDVTRVLAGGMAVGAPAALCFEALLAAGATSKLLRAMLGASLALIPAAAIGAWFGTVPMAWGLLIGTMAGTGIWLAVTHTELRFDWAALRVQLGRSAAVAISSSVVPIGLLLIFGARPQHYHLALLAVGLVGAGVCFVVSAHWFGHPIADEIRPLLARLRAKLGR